MEESLSTSVIFLKIVCIYMAITAYVAFIVHSNSWITAIVLAIGFLLSTLTLLFFKSFWIKYVYTKK